MLCGPGVPSLRSLWGAIRNRQLYILRMYCKGWISFNFSIFFIIYTTYSKKKKLHDLPQKLKNSIFFYNSHDLQQKKKITRIYSIKKKLHDYTVFLYTTYIFHRKEHGVTGHCVLCRWALAAGLHYSTWTEYCHICNSPSRPKGAYGPTDEDFFVLTCACSCD